MLITSSDTASHINTGDSVQEGDHAMFEVLSEVESEPKTTTSIKVGVKKAQGDGWFVSGQPWELAYLTRDLVKEFPRRTLAAVEIAIGMARRRVRPMEGKEKLTECIRQMLRR